MGLDLADPDACRAAVVAHQPDWVLNAGAYTAVDRAEAEPELAQAVNAGAPRAFAEALARISDSSRLLQISTDFVFSGEQSHPYRPEDPRNPMSAYGTSKAAGEQAVADALGTADHAGLSGRATILRTSWVYGPVGRNFLLTMLRLHHQKAARASPCAWWPIRWVVPPARPDWRAPAGPRSSAVRPASCTGAMPVWPVGMTSRWRSVSWASSIGLLEQSGQSAADLHRRLPHPGPAPQLFPARLHSTRAQLDLAPRHWRDALNHTFLHNKDGLQQLIQAAKT